MNKEKVLFICTNNSARSQIAEGLLKSMYSNKYEVYSAGVQPTSLNPLATTVMSEIGIDISKQKSKSIEKYREELFDIVVTVCHSAKESCPFFPGKKIIHKSFIDPKQNLNSFRKIRDDIKNWIIKNFN
jgi:arsenate reductase